MYDLKYKEKYTSIKAFTLVELLVVISVISVLMSVMLPCLGRAKRQSRQTICRSNIRQLYIANCGYALDNAGFYVRAAYDIYEGFGGRHRWHGVRLSSAVDPDPSKNTFDPRKGPLRAYLTDGQVKSCPAIIRFTDEGSSNAFEAGCGGYGYNSVGVGSRTYQYGMSDRAMRSSMNITEIEKAYSKIMFTDTAFIQGSGTGRYIIEYSFCEPPKAVLNFGSGPIETGQLNPSIHFRHLGKTTVIWCDGHTSTEQLDFPESRKSEPEKFRIGWFGPSDNSLFRPH